MPAVFSKLTEMPYEEEDHRGELQYAEGKWFDFGRDIYKPLPCPYVLRVLRQPSNKRQVREWVKDEIHKKTNKMKVYKQQKGELRGIIRGMEDVKKDLPDNAIIQQLYFIPEKDSSLGHPGKKISLGNAKQMLENSTRNYTDLNLQNHVLTLLYNDKKKTYKSNRKEARARLNTLKLAYGELLEEVEESDAGFCICDPCGNNATYDGKAGKEQNYIKAAEVLQETCNMLENMFDILER